MTLTKLLTSEGLVITHHLKLLGIRIVLSAVNVDILIVVIIRIQLIRVVHLLG